MKILSQIRLEFHRTRLLVALYLNLEGFSLLNPSAPINTSPRFVMVFLGVHEIHLRSDDLSMLADLDSNEFLSKSRLVHQSYGF